MKEECIALKGNYNLGDLESAEFNKIVFAGAEVAEMRGPSDAFTKEELQRIANSESFDHWPSSDRWWVYNALTADLEEPEPQGRAHMVCAQTVKLGEVKTPNLIEPSNTRKLLGMVAALNVFATPVLCDGDPVRIIVTGKGGGPSGEVSVNHNGDINVSDKTGRVVATGRIGKGDTVELKDSKGKVVLSLKKGGK